MLEKPDFPDEKISQCLQMAYGLPVTQVTFLPLGADVNTAVYKAVTWVGEVYFVKLRRGRFDETAVLLPKFFSDQGIKAIIAPLTTLSGHLWADLNPFKLILYPFVVGQDGYEQPLADHHWHDLGTALKQIHTMPIPGALSQQIQPETYTPQWREMVQLFLVRLEGEVFADPVAQKAAAFLHSKGAEIQALVRRTEWLGQRLQRQSPEFIVCHSDLHAGNILLAADDALYIVDWDNPILAPKERDLMFIGGGQMGNRLTPQAEATLFYQTYGQSEIDPVALAYYRYERIIQDIAVFCEQIFLVDEGGEDREQAFTYLKASFQPQGVLAISYEFDET